MLPFPFNINSSRSLYCSIDFPDERKLMIDELRSFFSLLFGTEQHRIPDPTVEWKAFLQFVEDALEYEKVQWDPIKKKSLPWVNVKVLHKIYGKGTCSIMQYCTVQ